MAIILLNIFENLKVFQNQKLRTLGTENSYHALVT